MKGPTTKDEKTTVIVTTRARVGNGQGIGGVKAHYAAFCARERVVVVWNGEPLSFLARFDDLSGA